MEVKRDAYLQQLIERKDNGVGADHIIEIALDGIENEELNRILSFRNHRAYVFNSICSFFSNHVRDTKIP